MANFTDTKDNEVINPLHLVRILNIPPADNFHTIESLYLTDNDTNISWVNENGTEEMYYAIGMEVTSAERSKEQESDQCQIKFDNVPNDFTALAQYYKLNGVTVQVFLGFIDSLSSGEGGATLMFEGHVRGATISQYSAELIVSNGYDGMDKVPRRMCWKSLFPYIPSAKDPRTLVIG